MAADGHETILLRSVLLVEDEPDTARTFKILLEHSGHDVYTAPDAAAALTILHDARIDVVLCDLGLPGSMSGLDLAARAQQDPALRHIPFVAVTGYAREQDRRDTGGLGFAAHLTKPVELRAIEHVFRDIAFTQRKGQRPG